jgi:hypothetical protein
MDDFLSSETPRTRLSSRKSSQVSIPVLQRDRSLVGPTPSRRMKEFLSIAPQHPVPAI